jgi:hypothetical protein
MRDSLRYPAEADFSHLGGYWKVKKMRNGFHWQGPLLLLAATLICFCGTAIANASNQVF